MLLVSLFNLEGLCKIIERMNTGREETRAKNRGLDQTKMIRKREMWGDPEGTARQTIPTNS